MNETTLRLTDRQVKLVKLLITAADTDPTIPVCDLRGFKAYKSAMAGLRKSLETAEQNVAYSATAPRGYRPDNGY